MESRFVKTRDLEIASLDDQSLVLQPASGRFHLLNSTASFIFARLDEPHTATELADDVVAQFRGVDLTVALAGVKAALDRMLGEQIANTVDELED